VCEGGGAGCGVGVGGRSVVCMSVWAGLLIPIIIAHTTAYVCGVCLGDFLLSLWLKDCH